MSIINNFKNSKEGIISILKSRPDARDNDNLLLALYWFYKHREDVESLSAIDFLKNLTKGKYENFETIRRMRQKIQEQYPELRGEKYKARHKEEKEVRININQI